jgi:hypothetical protein
MENKKYLIEEIEFKDLIYQISNLCDILSGNNNTIGIEKPVSMDLAMDYLEVKTKRKMHDLMNRSENPIPFHKVNRSTRYFLSELKEWLLKN